MKNNKKIQKSKYKSRLFFKFIIGLIYGFAIGYFIATPFKDTCSFGFLASAGLMGGFGLVENIFWYVRKDEKSKTKK